MIFLKKKDLPESKQSKINPARIAIIAFTAITITAFALAYILKLIGLFNDVMLAMIIFMTVALGVVIATLKRKRNLISADWANHIINSRSRGSNSFIAVDYLCFN